MVFDLYPIVNGLKSCDILRIMHVCAPQIMTLYKRRLLSVVVVVGWFEKITWAFCGYWFSLMSQMQEGIIHSAGIFELVLSMFYECFSWFHNKYEWLDMFGLSNKKLVTIFLRLRV